MVTGSCHCGKTFFRIAGELPLSVTRCTCSICSKRGALNAYYSPEQFSVTAHADRIYRWGSQLVSSHFCAECGCTTYTDSPAFELDGKWDGKTRRIGANARLFRDFDAATAPVAINTPRLRRTSLRNLYNRLGGRATTGSLFRWRCRSIARPLAVS